MKESKGQNQCDISVCRHAKHWRFQLQLSPLFIFAKKFLPSPTLPLHLPYLSIRGCHLWQQAHYGLDQAEKPHFYLYLVICRLRVVLSKDQNRLFVQARLYKTQVAKCKSICRESRAILCVQANHPTHFVSGCKPHLPRPVNRTPSRLLPTPHKLTGVTAPALS